MKKTLSLTLASLLCAVSPMAADTAAVTAVEQLQETKLIRGADFVQAVRAKYQAGEYKEFLMKMDQDYQAAKTESELEGLIAIRSEDALIAVEQAADMDRWNAVAKGWMQERNKDLLEAVENLNDSVLADKVRSLTTSVSSDEEKAISYFLDLRKILPGAGKNSDENRLVEIDLASEYKQIHLDSQIAMGQSNVDRREKQLALRIEKMDQMVQASQSFEDQELKKTVALLSETADSRYAKGIDLTDISNLARGKIDASNDLEKKIASIFSSYQGKFTDLTKQMFDQSSEAKN